MASIAAIYLAGLTITEPAAEQIAAAENGGQPTIPTANSGAGAAIHPGSSQPAVAGVSQTLPTATATPPAIAASAPPNRPATPTTASQALATPTTRATATPVKTPTPVATPRATASGYQDGSYSGRGVSRRGNVEVSVTIQGVKIASVAITRCTTQYPQSLINGLPSEVVVRQTWQVDLISGATYSTHAFQDAVRQALTSAAQGGTVA